MFEFNSKDRQTKDGHTQPIEISKRFRSSWSKRGEVLPSVSRSIFTRIIEHNSTAKRESNIHGVSELEVYSILRTETRERLDEAYRRGFVDAQRARLAA